MVARLHDGTQTHPINCRDAVAVSEVLRLVSCYWFLRILVIPDFTQIPSSNACGLPKAFGIFQTPLIYHDRGMFSSLLEKAQDFSQPTPSVYLLSPFL